ncbi:MAG: GNAT family N-acetyltransferase [Desulfobacterota bacterium]|nr:GNAT family N-acetyltransferase [Thermodesulfobacteriota bacterium]
MAKILIRKMRKDDVDEVSRIDAAITKSPSRLNFKPIVAEATRKNSNASLIAEIRGKVVGFMISIITAGIFGTEKVAWISMFGVDPKYMGQEVGKNLAKGIFDYYKEKKVKRIYTSVRWDSTDLLSFFKTIGFERSNFINLRKDL